MGGGAWPFLVGGAICLVNSDNERDSSLLTRRTFRYLEGQRLLVSVAVAVTAVGCAAREFVVFTTGVQLNLLRGTGGS